MRAAYERLTSILSDPDECGMSALDCIYEIMENEAVSYTHLTLPTKA